MICKARTEIIRRLPAVYTLKGGQHIECLRGGSSSDPDPPLGYIVSFSPFTSGPYF